MIVTIYSQLRHESTRRLHGDWRRASEVEVWAFEPMPDYSIESVADDPACETFALREGRYGTEPYIRAEVPGAALIRTGAGVRLRLPVTLEKLTPEQAGSRIRRGRPGFRRLDVAGVEATDQRPERPGRCDPAPGPTRQATLF